MHSDMEGEVFKTAAGTSSSRKEPGYDGLSQIPYVALRRIGAIFKEGELKHGRDNWKNGASDPEFREERWNHMIRHAYLWIEGDRSADHLAKIGWAAVALMWLEEIERSGVPMDVLRQVREAKIDYEKVEAMGGFHPGMVLPMVEAPDPPKQIGQPSSGVITWDESLRSFVFHKEGSISTAFTPELLESLLRDANRTVPPYDPDTGRAIGEDDVPF